MGSDPIDAADGPAGHRAGRQAAQRMESAAMSVETFDSVFDALADTPAEAANLTARADVLLATRERVKGWQAQGGLT